MEHVLFHLEMYIQRFCNMLGPGNRRYIQIMIVLARAFLQTLCQTSASDIDTLSLEDSSGSTALDSSMAINEFLFSLNIDNINLVKLLEYIKESNIIHKVSIVLFSYTTVLPKTCLAPFHCNCPEPLLLGQWVRR